MTLSVRVTLLKFYPTINHGLLRNQYVHNNLIMHMKLIKWLSWFWAAGSSHSHTSPLRSTPNSGFHSAPKPQIKLLYYFFCLIVPGLDCQIPSEEWPRSSQLTKCPSEWILPTISSNPTIWMKSIIIIEKNGLFMQKVSQFISLSPSASFSIKPLYVQLVHASEIFFFCFLFCSSHSIIMIITIIITSSKPRWI